MYFVQNLSLGILGKPDPTELWEEIIAQIPDEALMFRGQNFLFPAVGHATEILVLNKRLMSLGWTKEQIIDHFYICDKYYCFTNVVKANGFKHIYTGNFLEWDLDMKFDIIIGNPPYQDPDAKSSKKLWPLFVKKSFELLTDDGIMALITPNSWMLPGSDLFELFKNNRCISINLDSKKYFRNVGTSISYYVIQKSKDCIDTSTTISTSEEVFEVKLKELQFIPNIMHSKTLSILDKLLNTDERMNVEYNSFCHSARTDRVSNTKNDIFRYPVKHGAESMLWSNTPHTSAHLKKIMFYMSGKMKPFYDSGINGASEHHGWIVVEDEITATNVHNFLTSNIITFILATCNYYQAWCKPLLNLLPAVDFSHSWTDDALYKHFNLTQEEIKYIEDTIG